MTVWVLIIDHKHGQNLSVHASETGALDNVYAYVEEWWEHEMEGAPLTADKQQAVSDYFDCMAGTECYTITKCGVEA